MPHLNPRGFPRDSQSLVELIFHAIPALLQEEKDMQELSIGQTIAQLRKQAGMTQKELADKLFVTPQAVSR